MTKTTAALLRREERTMRRKAQILEAARTCVLEEGFHAATISRIAAAAAMSKGHIYKYYENKDAIMTALIEHHMHEFNGIISHIDQSDHPTVDSLVDSFVRNLPDILDSDRTSLWLEVQAEAARNPKVKEMAVKSADAFRETIRKVMEPVLDKPTKEELDFRAEMLLVSMHGLGLHATVHAGPASAFATAVEFAFRAVLSPAPQAQVARKIKAA